MNTEWSTTFWLQTDIEAKVSSMGRQDLICRFVKDVGNDEAYLFGFPHFQDWHASNDGVGVFLSGWVHRVIGSDDQHQVGFWMQPE